jgi:hypothetical protein
MRQMEPELTSHLADRKTKPQIGWEIYMHMDNQNQG